MKKYILILFLLIFGRNLFGQLQVALTIDDVPNVGKFEKDGFYSKLHHNLDSLNIPVAIFVVDSFIYKTNAVAENKRLLESWIKSDYVTVGNHTFAHTRYSEVGFEVFKNDIIQGEVELKSVAAGWDKTLRYFRFPYNDLGIDSVQQQAVNSFLNDRQSIITPFTIESSDWVFNYLYEYYLNKHNLQSAKQVADAYINTTIGYFQYFDSLSQCFYNRSINQIYLCHDNSINADYLSLLVERLKEKGYSFISLDAAMQDEVYKQPNYYNKKWGISWFYRWMSNSRQRNELMNNEPDMMNVYKAYQALISKNSAEN